MKRKTIRERIGGMIIVILLPLVIGVPPVAFGVSYPPSQLYHKEERHDRLVKGDVVYLFHSGIADVRKTIHVNDNLTVYRISPSCEVTPIGIIKVVSFVGETYLKGEVFDGEIMPDDIAKKGTLSCLVISAGMCGE